MPAIERQGHVNNGSSRAHAVYAKSLARARKLGALTGCVHGTSSIKDPQVQGGLRLQENIIG